VSSTVVCVTCGREIERIGEVWLLAHPYRWDLFISLCRGGADHRPTSEGEVCSEDHSR
jgi:hypothetical protein